MTHVLLIGTLDTKGPEIAYLRDRIQALGVGTIVADSGILGEPLDITPDVTREEIATLGGTTIEALRNAGSRGKAVHGMLAGIGISIAFALCFCWISVFVGMKARTSGAVQGIMFLIVLPLTFGSNTFVNPDTMPTWLQTFVNVNPISQLVTTVRGLMIGGPVATSLMWTLVWMAILLVVFVPLALRGYRKRA